MASPSYLGLCCLFVFSLISLQAGETESSVQLVSPHVGKPVITKAVAANRLASVPDYVSAFEEARDPEQEQALVQDPVPCRWGPRLNWCR